MRGGIPPPCGMPYDHGIVPADVGKLALISGPAALIILFAVRAAAGIVPIQVSRRIRAFSLDLIRIGIELLRNNTDCPAGMPRIREIHD